MPDSDTAPQGDSGDSTPNSSTLGRWGFFGLSLLVLMVVIGYLLDAEDTVDIEHKDQAPVLPVVSVEIVSLAPETVQVETFAEVRPRWSAQLRAAVSGRINEVHNSALAGERVTAGTRLITIEDSAYRAELRAAALAVEEAQLALSKAQKATAVARRQFKQNGTKPPNDLALHLPQLRIAKTAVESAQASEAAARQRLQDAAIDAPFSGFVTERFVSPGQSINPGDPLLKLVDDTRFEITAELGSRDWSLLRQPLSGLSARVLDQHGEFLTQAKIRQGGGFLDETTRQYKVFMQVHDPATVVLSGDFVRVQLPGIRVPAALNIPASALTQEGYVWHVDEQARLQRMSPQILFRQHDRLVIRAPQGPDTWQIATTPLVSYLPGRMVRPEPLEP